MNCQLSADMQFLDRGLQGKIAWRADGDANHPALVLGNSLGADHTSWDTVLPRLSAHFRVIRFDARGHGASILHAGTRGEDYSIAMLARDTLAVADAAGARRFHYLGLSIGGMIGMWLAQHAADRLDRLVLSNTAAILAADVWTERIAAVRMSGMQALVDTTMQRWFTPTFHAISDGKLIANTRNIFLRTDADGYIGCAAAIRDMDLREGLANINAPTLVINGSFDPSTPPALGQEIAARIPGARCIELPVAHIPQLEQPEQFANVVTTFLLSPSDSSAGSLLR